MAVSRYRKFLLICNRWPVDEYKKTSGRDLATRLREEVVTRFSSGERTVLPDPDHCDRSLEALTELLENRHRNDFPLSLQRGVMGCTADQCRLVTSDQHYSALQRRQGVLSALRERLHSLRRRLTG